MIIYNASNSDDYEYLFYIIQCHNSSYTYTSDKITREIFNCFNDDLFIKAYHQLDNVHNPIITEHYNNIRSKRIRKILK